MQKITINMNGADVTAEVEPRLLLVHFIRDVANMTGTHIGCDTTSCGACTVLIEGKPIKSCTVLSVQADGKRVMTVEGLVQDGKLHRRGVKTGRLLHEDRHRELLRAADQVSGASLNFKFFSIIGI